MHRLIKNTRGYRIGKPGERRLKRTHSLFIDHLKVYQENHKRLEVVNEMIVQASYNTARSILWSFKMRGNRFQKRKDDKR